MRKLQVALRQFIYKHGIAQTITFITVLAVIISAFLTLSVLVTVGVSDEIDMLVGFVISIIVPIVLAPSSLFVIFKLLVQIDEAERAHAQLVIELQEALATAKTLSGLLPICSSCKKIRDDEGYWHQVEVYVRDHSEANFSHGICPDCMEKMRAELAEMKSQKLGL